MTRRIWGFDPEDLEDADLAAIGFDPAARERLLQVVKMGPSAREETDFKDAPVRLCDAVGVAVLFKGLSVLDLQGFLARALRSVNDGSSAQRLSWLCS